MAIYVSVVIGTTIYSAIRARRVIGARIVNNALAGMACAHAQDTGGATAVVRAEALDAVSAM